MNKGKKCLKGYLEVGQSIAVIAGLFFAGYQLHLQTKALEDTHAQTTLQTKALEDNRIINSASFLLKVSDEFDKPKYQKLIDAIDDHGCKYHVCKRFKPRLIEDYIGNFETLGCLVEDKIITPKMAFDELGYEMENLVQRKHTKLYRRDQESR